jgi:hypothetical protein
MGRDATAIGTGAATGAAAGAGIGSVIPGVGTLVGAGAGAFVGGALGATKAFTGPGKADFSWRGYQPGAAIGKYQGLTSQDIGGAGELAQMQAPQNMRLAQARQLAARDYMTPLQKAIADAQANRGVQGQNIDQYEAQRALGRGAAMEGQYQSQKGTLDLASLDASRNQAFASRGRGMAGGSQAASEQATNQMQYGAALQNARLQAQLLGQGMQGQDITQANQFRLQNQEVSPGEEAAYAAANQGLQDYQGQSQRQAGLLGNYYQQMYGAQGQAQGDYTQAALAQLQGGQAQYRNYLGQMTGDRDTMGNSLNQAYLQRTDQMSDLERQMYAAKDQGEAAVKAAKDKYNQNLYGLFGDAAGLGVIGAMNAFGGDAPTGSAGTAGKYNAGSVQQLKTSSGNAV